MLSGNGPAKLNLLPSLKPFSHHPKLCGLIKSGNGPAKLNLLPSFELFSNYSKWCGSIYSGNGPAKLNLLPSFELSSHYPKWRGSIYSGNGPAKLNLLPILHSSIVTELNTLILQISRVRRLHEYPSLAISGQSLIKIIPQPTLRYFLLLAAERKYNSRLLYPALRY